MIPSINLKIIFIIVSRISFESIFNIAVAIRIVIICNFIVLVKFFDTLAQNVSISFFSI